VRLDRYLCRGEAIASPPLLTRFLWAIAREEDRTVIGGETGAVLITRIDAACVRVVDQVEPAGCHLWGTRSDEGRALVRADLQAGAIDIEVGRVVGQCLGPSKGSCQPRQGCSYTTKPYAYHVGILPVHA